MDPVMNFADYLCGISFRFIKPQTPLLKPLAQFLDGLSRLGFPLERWIAKLPSDDKHMKRTLRGICRIPKMSTFALGAIINRCVSQMPDNQVYVNVGVWHGFTFLSGLINNDHKKCVGIDNFSRKIQHGERKKFPLRFNKYKSDNHRFYEMDYLQYFAEIHKEPIGFYLYDGWHRYNSQLESLEVAEPFFAKDCIIFIDDANEDDTRNATMDFLASRPNRYDILLDGTTYCNRHPTYWNGVLIFQKVK